MAYRTDRSYGRRPKLISASSCFMNDGLAGFDDEFGAGACDASGFSDFVDYFVVGGVSLVGEVAHDIAAFAIVELITGIAIT